MAASTQPAIPFGPVHNAGLFSSHWLENRLKLEPEWEELREPAREVLDNLTDLWMVQRNRVERYGDEQGLEEGFIQPVLRGLGWKLKYQTWLQKREPDYALFLDDAGLDAALAADRQSEDFWAAAKVVADSKAWHVSLDRPSQVNNRREYPPEQDEALDLLRPLLAKAPFSPAVRQVVVAVVQRIMALEADRGEIARVERSALDPAAQPYQDLIDRLFYGMAGLTGDEVKALEGRYATML